MYMKTTSEILQDMLLKGRKINKFNFLDETNSVCLAQRILELRQMGWNIRSRSIKGKGNLREYWLEREEIDRLKNKPSQSLPVEAEELTEDDINIAQNGFEGFTEQEEQLGLGLPGFSNY